MRQNLGHARNLWAKSRSNSQPDNEPWHPLALHLLDVAAVADAAIAREPESTRTRLALLLGCHYSELISVSTRKA